MSAPAVLFWKRFVRKPSGVIGGVICLFIAFVALSAPLLTIYDPIQQKLEDSKQTPSAEHLMGTDDVGRDIFSRVAHGARITLSVGFIAVGIALALGTPLALLSVWGGKRMDLFVSGFIDVFLAFPSLVLALAIVTILGQNLTNAMVAIGIVYMPRIARVLRGAAISEIGRDYVAAARSLSCSTPRILLRHVLPNCLPALMVTSTLYLASAILEAAALSFLGLGAEPPAPEWGRMLYDGRQFLLQAPYMTWFPGMAIFITVLGINLLGDAVNDTLGGR
ncbi:MAG: ABC transporter permease [Candidatus Hinthialibacter antarcticus]|nr:ABC transporter permease [Candidatus Hinthialibacter antarcticus]